MQTFRDYMKSLTTNFSDFMQLLKLVRDYMKFLNMIVIS